ncbi:hypothetical protein [Piscinibacter sp.]|uniref:hypothetical protein n=1 Tax=Piscinibacter sp. TaxID=1903157 RepID=UPI0039E4DA52
MNIPTLGETLVASYFTLYRPEAAAPLHAWRPYLSWCRVVDESLPPRNLQRILPPAFRESLQAEIGGRRNLAPTHPFSLDSDLVTPAWMQLCERVRTCPSLSLQQRARVLGLLLSLGYFQLVLKLGRMPDSTELAADRDAASIAGSIAASSLILALEGLQPFSLEGFKKIATHVPRGSIVRFDALMNLVVQYGKSTYDVSAAQSWREEAHRELDAQLALHGTDSFNGHLLASRFYRGASYVPFLLGQREAVMREMELCEQHARAMVPRDEIDELIWRENMLPVLQSRSKEARWIGDLELAHERLAEGCSIDPSDPVRWIELGEVRLDLGHYEDAEDCYSRAAAFAPPGAALSSYMVGECERLQGHEAMACLYYQRALSIDPLCSSALRQLCALAPVSGLAALVETHAA